MAALRVGLMRITDGLRGKAHNVQRHYDIGDDLFEAFLDKTLTYSCGYATHPEDDLEKLQQNVWVGLLVIAVVPAICEEVAFRGFILSGLEREYRPVTAIVLSALLFGVSQHDPGTFTGVAVIMLAVGGIATLVPAYRATRVDPIVTLRSE